MFLKSDYELMVDNQRREAKRFLDTAASEEATAEEYRKIPNIGEALAHGCHLRAQNYREQAERAEREAAYWAGFMEVNDEVQTAVEA